MTPKITFLLISFCLLLDVPHLRAQQRSEEFQHILLRLLFPPFYNSYNKSCCKLYPAGCYRLLDSAGYTCGFLKGRVSATEGDGWIEFKISAVQIGDAGLYRCRVLGTQSQIYSDYYVEVVEASDHQSRSHSLMTTTTQPAVSFTANPESTGPALAWDHGEHHRTPWGFKLPLTVIGSTSVMAFVASVIVAVYCRSKAKWKQSDRFGETLSDSLKQEALEANCIVYTTVDFTSRQKVEEVYENLRGHGVPDSGGVEYSTLAFQM